MNDQFLILIDRLKGGRTEKIADSFSPAFLEIEENDLKFDEPVLVKGEVYISEDQLILHLFASTNAIMPCSICNEMFKTNLKIENFYHTVPIEEIPSAIFDFREILREALLLELPKFAECSQGKCPSRASIKSYLRSEKSAEKAHFPFKDLDS